LATGTPAASASALIPPRYLAAGDEVRVAISGIGELVNTFI